MSADSIEKIADEILDLISRCPDELTASVVLANIRRKAYTLRALPSLAELERDAQHLEWLAENARIETPDWIHDGRDPASTKCVLQRAIAAARAKEAKPSDKCSWCGGPNPCNCTDEDCAP